MAAHIGEEFDGVISGVTAFGMFVELENGVEGLIHVSSLMDDYYDFFDDRYALVGAHKHNVYRLGDKIRIEVLQVNIADRNVDFILAGESDSIRDQIRVQLLGQRSSGSKKSFGSSKDDKKKKKKDTIKSSFAKHGKGVIGGNKYATKTKGGKKKSKKK